MDKGKWVKSVKTSKQGIFKDGFGDSKFGLDMCNYFPREMIQNALDVKKDKDKPLKMTFRFEKIETSEIPGIEELKEVVEKCKQAKEVQVDTKRQYEKVLKQIESGAVMCLKVSDSNTYGVVRMEDGIIDGRIDNESWRALIYDEGHTVKSEIGSSGRHGVGKKVAFILSTFRTVFYYTHNEEDIIMFQGKSVLTDFFDDGKKYSNLLWYGKTGVDENDPVPLEKEELDGISSFFLRKEADKGTDIIIVGVDGIEVEKDLDNVKRKIILGILDNFFVAIKRKELVVDVQGISISNLDNEFDDFLSEYRDEYEKEYRRMVDDEYTKSTQGKSNLQYGNLYNYYLAYSDGKEINIPVIDENVQIGNVKMRILAENSFGKKYVAIFRKHGMKIKDLGPVSRASSPFSATVEIEGEKLNELLGEAENAAHDDFEVWIGNESKKSIYEKMIRDIKEEIKNYTKIDVADEIPLDDLVGETYCFVGDKNIAILRENDEEEKQIVRNVELRRKKKDKKSNKEGTEREEKEQKKKNKKDQKTGKVVNGKKYQRIEDFEQDPVIIYSKKTSEYLLYFKLKEYVNNIVVDLNAVNSDGNDEAIIKEYISQVYEGEKRYKVNRVDGTIRQDNIKGGKCEFVIQIKLKKKLRYQIKPVIYTQIQEVTYEK